MIETKFVVFIALYVLFVRIRRHCAAFKETCDVRLAQPYWNSFWQSFASAVRGRDDLSDVDKYNYLKSLLTDKAQEVISGLSLTAENYYEAIELLEQRYADKVKLAHTWKTCMNNINNLRRLHDTIESSIRNLTALKVESKSYGALLIPLLNEKLPNEIRIIIASKFNGTVWNLDDMMKYFKKELTANERCYSIPTSFDRKEEKDELPFTCSLVNQTTNRCLFCNHPHPTFICRKVTEVRSRRSIVRVIIFVNVVTENTILVSARITESIIETNRRMESIPTEKRPKLFRQQRLSPEISPTYC